MRLIWRFAIVVLLISSADHWRAQASTTAADRELQVQDHLRLKRAGDPQISPQGRHVAYEVREADRARDRWSTTLWLTDTRTGTSRPLAQGREARWSPDGREIAYLAVPEGGKSPQIFAASIEGQAPPRQITSLPDAPQNIGWSPDGRLIGFVRRLPDAQKPQTASAGATLDALGPPLREIHKIHDRLDGVGAFDTGFQHFFVVPAAGGDVRQITSGEWTLGAVFEGVAFGTRWTWLADGRAIVAEGYREGEIDRNIKDGNLYRIALDDGSVVRLTRERGTWASPALSPDGRTIAFLGHAADGHILSASDLYVMNIDGGDIRRIGREIYWDPVIAPDQALIWAPDSSGVYFTPAVRGSANLRFAPVDGSGERALTNGPRMLTISSRAGDGTIAALHATWERPAEIVLLKTGDRKPKITPVTRLNPWLDGRALATSEELWVEARDGPPVQGWLVKPAGFDPKRKYPLILEIHGGPQAMYNSAFNLNWQIYAAAGYAVLYMNPRGSTGYGNEFVHAIENGNYPGLEALDLMAGIDHVVADGAIDPARLYVSGCSAGGTIAAWMIGHSDRFAAASVRCMVSDWVTMAGASDIPFFAYGFFDKPFWEDPEGWWQRSPLAYVGKVKTPTLIVHGELDQRTPATMASSYFRALKMRNVPTRMLMLENEGHIPKRPSSVVKTLFHTIEWFDRHQPAGTPQP